MKSLLLMIGLFSMFSYQDLLFAEELQRSKIDSSQIQPPQRLKPRLKKKSAPNSKPLILPESEKTMEEEWLIGTPPNKERKKLKLENLDKVQEEADLEPFPK